MMLYASASRAPQWALLFMRPPFNGGFTFFVMFNALMEWLFLPAALFLNWRVPTRRRLLLAGAMVYDGAGYPRKAGHSIASNTYRQSLGALPRSWQVINF